MSIRPRGVVVFALLACGAGCPATDVEVDDDIDGRAEGEGEGEGEDPITGSCDVDKAGLGANAVYFGTREPSHVVLSAAQKRAVVGLQEGNAEGAVCSGTLIADDVVLTANHCVEGTAATRFRVIFGVDDLHPELLVNVVEKTENPDHDIAMLRLESRPADRIDVTPIAVFANRLDDDDAGEIFEQAGYGATEDSDGDGRFFVAEIFDGFEDDFLRVNGEGRHGVCFGDSGGPSLRQTAEGDVRVMGALSWGDESCVGVDRYTRVDLVLDWVAAFAGPVPLPGSSTVECGATTSAGRCSPDGRVAEFCDGDLVTDACDSDEVCADSAAGKRCIEKTADPCGGVTTFGSCADDVLSWCDGGVARTRDCGACGGDVCALVDNVVGYACIEDACGGVTFLGECDGDVARWCSDGQLKEQNCADSRDTCGFVDDETGFFCT